MEYEYRIIQLGGDRLSVNRLTKLEESQNELVNVINGVNAHVFTSIKGFIDAHFSDKENDIITDVKIENVNDRVRITVNYFSYFFADEKYGGHYFDEYNKVFTIAKNGFYGTLYDSVVFKSEEVKCNKQEIMNKIDQIKNDIINTRRIIQEVEAFILDYLKNNENDEEVSFSSQEFNDCIRDRLSLVKQVIKMNWKYGNIFEGVYLVLALAVPTLCFYTGYTFQDQEPEKHLVKCVSYLCLFLIAGLIEDGLIKHKIAEISDNVSAKDKIKEKKI